MERDALDAELGKVGSVERLFQAEPGGVQRPGI